jgi:hypothetical protein
MVIASYEASARTYIDAIANCRRTPLFSSSGNSYSDILTQVAVFTNFHAGIDDNSAKVTDVKPFADVRLVRQINASGDFNELVPHMAEQSQNLSNHGYMNFGTSPTAESIFSQRP